MSGSMMPRRRTRDELTDADSAEDDVSSQGSKRRRVHDEATDSDEESPERPVLPDTYRRSPKGKGRARDNVSDSHDEQDHLPGSIVRVKLTNFVTYTRAEFRPGPNLNMVIGPNGTGKSTLVCAICIGLGWSTSNLARAKDVTEFVKHGSKTAEIEIELKADPDRHSHNPVITHKINKEGGSGKSAPKSTYLIDGKKCTGKAANDLAKSFSIQVDNLCQFLPQDRVVEFAALNSVDLLAETLRAAAPEQMIQWHEQLKTMHKDEKQMRKNEQATIEQLKSLENRQKGQEVEVERLKEREAKKEEKRILEKLRPFAEYHSCQQKLIQAKAQLKAALREQRELQGKIQPNLDAIDSKRAYHARLDALVGQRSRLVARGEDNAEKKLKDYRDAMKLIDDADREIQTEKEGGRAGKKTVADLQANIRKTEQQLQSPPLEFNSEGMNRQIYDKGRELRQIENDISTVQEKKETLQEQARQRHQVVKEAEEKTQYLQSQAGQQTSKLDRVSKESGRAWRWIQENRDSFKGDVYGPPMIECSLKDVSYANQVETILNNSDVLAFTVTCQEDWTLLDQQLRRNMKLHDISIRISAKPLAEFSSPCSDEQMRHLGFEGWLIELIDGPDAVLAMLCDNSDLQKIPFTGGEISDDQFHRMRNSPIASCVSKTKRYQIFRRREYGDAATTTRVTEVRKAKYLTNIEVNTQEQQDLDRSIVMAKGELGDITKEMQDLEQQLQVKRAAANEINKEKETLEKEKREKQSQKTQYDGLHPKLEKYKQKLADAQAAQKGLSDRVMVIVEKQDKLCLEKGQHALDYARSLESLRKLHENLLEAEVKRIEAKSDLEQLEAKNADETRLLEEKEVESARAREAKHAAHQRGLEVQRQCTTVGETLTPEEEDMQQRMQHEVWDLERLGSDIAQLDASLEMLADGNHRLIDEYTRRAQKLEDKRAQLARMERELEDVTAKIKNIFERWEPHLEDIISKISEAFSDNFSRIQCAGEVAIHKDDDFEQWAIHIKVKFRENEQLCVLDAHRQSGGERAVSTIFYLMALQSLARAPFRVVDEINQGMDPRNERLVHSRMVEIACAEHTSQYFLITPKLLNNLKYHPSMKVHCIASGEHMPEDHKELDFEMLAQRALEICGVSS